MAAENLIKSLSMEGKPEDCNNDFDLGEVIKYCHDDTVTEHKFRYSDGTEKIFSFGD